MLSKSPPPPESVPPHRPEPSSGIKRAISEILILAAAVTLTSHLTSQFFLALGRKQTRDAVEERLGCLSLTGVNVKIPDFEPQIPEANVDAELVRACAEIGIEVSRASAQAALNQEGASPSR